MNKKKIGALVGILGLTGVMAVAQFYQLDRIWASYTSQNFNKKKETVTLSDDGASSEPWKNGNSTEEDFRLPLFSRPQESAEEAESSNQNYQLDEENTLDKVLAEKNREIANDEELIVDGKPIFQGAGEESSDSREAEEEKPAEEQKNGEVVMALAEKGEPTREILEKTGLGRMEAEAGKDGENGEAKIVPQPVLAETNNLSEKAELIDEEKTNKSKEEQEKADKIKKEQEKEEKAQAEEKKADPSEKDQDSDPSSKDQAPADQKKAENAEKSAEEGKNAQENQENEKAGKKDFLEEALLNKDTPAGYTGKVILPVVNIRTAPSLDSDYAGALKEGDLVRGELKEGWLEMTINEETCYVSEKCLAPLEEDQIQELEKKELENKLEEIKKEAEEAQKQEDERKERQTPKPYQGYVQFKEASIMDGPDQDAKLIDNIKQNTLVKGEIRDGWVKFTYKGKEAYISEQFVGKAMVKIEKPKPKPKAQPNNAQKKASNFNQGNNAAMNRFFQPQKQLGNAAQVGARQGQGAIWPIAGYHSISYGIGPRWNSYHSGIDAPCPVGTPVKAIVGGTITHASWYGGYGGGGGNTIIIKQDDGYVCKYMHLSAIQTKVGQRVGTGSQIGLSGNTGFSTGPHLHIELTRGGQVLDARVVYGI